MRPTPSLLGGAAHWLSRGTVRKTITGRSKAAIRRRKELAREETVRRTVLKPTDNYIFKRDADWDLVVKELGLEGDEASIGRYTTEEILDLKTQAQIQIEERVAAAAREEMVGQPQDEKDEELATWKPQAYPGRSRLREELRMEMETAKDWKKVAAEVFGTPGIEQMDKGPGKGPRTIRHDNSNRGMRGMVLAQRERKDPLEEKLERLNAARPAMAIISPAVPAKRDFGLEKPEETKEEPEYSVTLSDGKMPTGFRWSIPTPSPWTLSRAEQWFAKFRPVFLWAAEKFALIPHSEVPEIVFLGRSNVGKSSLLNACIHTRIARTSSRAGTTRNLAAYACHNGRLTVIDVPGYGHASRPEWGAEIMKYLRNRRTFRRAFLLIDVEHGLKPLDRLMIDVMNAEGISYQLVMNKCDKFYRRSVRIEQRAVELREYCKSLSGGGSGLVEEILAVSANPENSRCGKSGINDVRLAILRAAGLDASL